MGFRKMGQPLEWINCNQDIASIGLKLRKGKLEEEKKAKTNFSLIWLFSSDNKIEWTNTHINNIFCISNSKII